MGREMGGDPQTDRRVGTYQQDAIGPHTHVFHDNTGTPTSETGNAGMTSHTNRGEIRRKVTDGPQASDPENIAPETRPRNIALYFYIKID